MAPAAFLLLLVLQGQDPVRVGARLNPEEVQAGETAVLRVDVETQGERAQIGRFQTLPPGITIEGTRDFDQRQFSIPGGTRRFVSREFVLRARAAGRYRIPTLDVIVEGRTYTTRSQILTVTAAPSSRGGAVSEGQSDGVILRAWLDADTVYVGEQVTMEAEAMFSQQVRLRLRRAPEYEPPTPSGFWVHDLPDRQRPTTRTSGGGVWEVQRFRRAFFPMEPGEYLIPPSRLEYEARRGLLYAPETRELTSDPLPLVVLPVPEPRPDGYTGAVGSFTIRGWLEPDAVHVGEATVLTVEVDGVGNLRTVPPPKLPEMEHVEVFPPGEEADVSPASGRLRGSKRFSWVLIPREPGELRIPEIRYPHFDPGTGDFEVARVAPQTLEVMPGTGTSELRPRPTLRYLETRPGSSDPLRWVRSSWFAAAQALPLLLLAMGIAWGRRGRRGDRPASRRSLRRLRTSGIRDLEARASEGGGALFTDADSFARRWLSDRLGIPPTETGLPAALTAGGVEEGTASAVSGLLQRLAAARYAPTPPAAEARTQLIHSLGRLLARVDREAPAPRRRRGGGGAGPGALLWLLLALQPAHAGATPIPAPIPAPAGALDQERPGGGATLPPSFQDGIEAYDQEMYWAAAEAFNRYLERRPRDPAGWYNLGTSYYRAGYPGYAIWAWLKVPGMDPRNDDVRHNLRVAGVPPELVARVAPPLPLRSTELLLLASLAWLLTAVAGALWLARRGRRAAATAAVAFLLALALAGAGWASTRDPETLIVLETSILRAGPALRADPVAELEAGSALTPVERRGDWVRARTLRGDEGWIETTVTGDI